MAPGDVDDLALYQRGLIFFGFQQVLLRRLGIF